MNTRPVVLQGWFGVDNFGDELLLELSLECLRRFAPGQKLMVIGEGSSRPELLAKHVAYYPRESRKWAWFRNRWLCSGCDWVLCGGSFFTEAVMDRFIMPAQRVKAGGGRVFVHAAGLRDSFRTGTEKLQQFLALVDGCSVREQFAQDLFSKFCSVSLVGDPVFSMPLIRCDVDPRLLVIAPRGEPPLEDEYVQKLRGLIKSWVQKSGRVEVLVCYPQQDYELAMQLGSGSDAVKIITASPKQLSERIAIAGAVLTMRLHPAIVSLVHDRIPWVLDAGHKHQMLMCEAGLERHLLSWNDINPFLASSLIAAPVNASVLRAMGGDSLDLLKKWIVE